MAGRVFVTHADLTKLWCDAWLLPCDVALSVTGGWRASLSPDVLAWVRSLRDGESARPQGWGNDGTRVIAFDGWTEHPPRPRPYLVNVGGVPGTEIDWFIEGARQFFRVVSEWTIRTAPIGGRSKPLISVPLIGTGDGGAAGIKGSIVRALIDAANVAADAFDFDVVLVTRSPLAFAAAQNARRQVREAGRDGSGGETETPQSALLADEIARLAAYAVDRRLVLFLGAGVSRGAGLPTWDELLAALAIEAGLSEREREALARMHQLDRARIIEARLAIAGHSLGHAVRALLASAHYSLSHSLLAALPVAEVVTTNYDGLFEEASADAGRDAAVLPYQPVRDHGRWLLKLHGSVTHPDDIVLTREDYLRYADRRAALAGIVQALLITRHMLFVGFSLSDDNFHRIVDDVRKAIRGSNGDAVPAAPFGTVLLLRPDDLLRELWESDLDLVSVSEPGNGTTPEAVRELENVLDTLVAEATRGASPLLDRTYDGVLTDEEREIQRLLTTLDADASPEARASHAWRPIAELLRSLGGSATETGR